MIQPNETAAAVRNEAREALGEEGAARHGEDPALAATSSATLVAGEQGLL